MTTQHGEEYDHQETSKHGIWHDMTPKTNHVMVFFFSQKKYGLLKYP